MAFRAEMDFDASAELVTRAAADVSVVQGEISRELRSQYLLAFAPDPPGKEGVFSTVEVKAQGGKLKTRAPRGYYP